VNSRIAARIQQVPTTELECLIGPRMTAVVGVFVSASNSEHADAGHVSVITVDKTRQVVPVRKDASKPRDRGNPTPREASPLRSMSVFSIEVSAAVSLRERLEMGTVEHYRQLAGVADGLVRDSDGFNNQILRCVTASIARSPASSD
jgi:hypothetical protein